MHGITWKWCLHSTEHRSQQARPRLASRSTRLAVGDICTLRVSHAQTARHIQTRFKDKPKKGKVQKSDNFTSRHAYVIKSFLLSLHWGYLGLGLGMVTSPGYLLSSRASWKGSKSSGCGQNTASGPQRWRLDTQTRGCVPPPRGMAALNCPPLPTLPLKSRCTLILRMQTQLRSKSTSLSGGL